MTRKWKSKQFIGAGLALGILLAPQITVWAYPSSFNVPNLTNAADYNPANGNWSNGYDLGYQDLPYGICGYILNYRHNVASAANDLAAQLPSKGKHDVSIYTEGDPLSATDCAALTSTGWTRMEVYYDDFEITGDIPAEGMNPDLTITNTEAVENLLRDYNFSGQYAEVTATGITMSWSYISYESSAFSFLSGTPYGYKYVPEAECFVKLDKIYFDAPYLIEFDNPQKIDGTANGIYIFSDTPIDTSYVKTPEEAVVLVGEAESRAQEEAESRAQEEALTEAEIEGTTIENAVEQRAETIEAAEEQEGESFPLSVAVAAGVGTVVATGGAAVYFTKIRLKK